MQKLIVVAFAALCLIGTSSLALADDAMKGEMGNMNDEMKAEKDAMKGDMKDKSKGHKEKTKGKAKGKSKGHMEKTKAHKDTAKAIPAAPAPMSAPAPAAAP
jgi:Sec-independent protein translocase protein TatA